MDMQAAMRAYWQICHRQHCGLGCVRHDSFSLREYVVVLLGSFCFFSELGQHMQLAAGDLAALALAYWVAAGLSVNTMKWLHSCC